MSTNSLTNVFNPYYVFSTGSFGVLIALGMFTWNYPLPDDLTGQTFVAAQPFWIWVFLFGILCCLLAILILPLWGLFFQQLNKQLQGQDAAQKRNTLLLVAFQVAILTGMVIFLLKFITSTQIGFDLAAYVPHGHEPRMNFMYAFTFLTALPGLLGMLLVHRGAQAITRKVTAAGEAESQLFPLIDELLAFRGLLQNLLSVLGLILSMIPLNTAGLRAILIVLDPANEQAFPITNAILFGLIFTLILLLIYLPAHLALTETSRKLRDRLCPLDSLASLKQDMEQRKTLDDLLQTNIGMAQNLKTGLITLAPLVTSLLTSILKINIPL